MLVAQRRNVFGMLSASLRGRWEQSLSARGLCPRCGYGGVWFNGIRLRKASVLDGANVHFADSVPVRRLKCGRCRARWSRPPDRVPSRAHYQPCVVSHALATLHESPEVPAAEIADAHGCHRRTLVRWIDRVADLAEPTQLAAALVAEADAPVLPALPTDVQRPGASARTLAKLLRAVTILALFEALASLRGLEPPALAHAAALVISMPAFAQRPRKRGDPDSPA